MQHIDVEKKRAARWPWLLGLAVLAFIIWGVSFLLRTPEQPEAPAIGVTAADTLPPALVPMPETREFGQPPDSDLSEIVPLEDDDVGTVLMLEGEVVATGNRSFWLLSDTVVLRVESARRARRGDSLAVTGTVRPAEAALTERIAAQVMSRHPEFERWTVVRPFKLVEQDQEDVPATEPG